MKLSEEFPEKIIVALITVCGAVVVALITYYKNKAKEERVRKGEEDKKLLELLSFVNTSLKINIKPIQSQIKAIDKLLIQLNRNKTMDLSFQLSTSLDFIEWTKSIDFIILKNAFFKHFHFNNKSAEWNERNKSYFYNQLIVVILHVRKIADTFATDFERIITEGNKYESLFDKGKTPLFELYYECKLIHHTAQYQQLQYFEKDYEDLFDKNHFAIKNPQYRNEMFRMARTLTKPLIQHGNKYPADSRTKIIVKCIQECGFAFDSYKKSLLFSRRRFGNYKQSLIWSAKRMSVLLLKNSIEWKII